MAYKETLDKTKKIMRYQKDLIAVFSVGGVEKLRKVLGIIESQLNQLNEGKKVVISDADKSRVKEIVDLFMNIAIYQPIAPIFRDLSEAYLVLVFNWNRELVGIADIAKNILATQHIVRRQMTIYETVNLVKMVSAKLERLSQYEPPAFELSKHYLKSLEGGQHG